MPTCLRLPLSLAISLITLFCLSVVAQDVPPNVVPQGTIFLIQISDHLDTRTVKAGDHFQARLAEPLDTGDGQRIQSGRKIKGHVSAVEPGFRTRLLLSFDEIDTGRGWVPLIATVTGVPGEHGLKQIGEEGEIGRQGMTKEQIAEAIVVGAGRGAAEGKRSGGNRGAAAGAGAGAARSGRNRRQCRLRRRCRRCGPGTRSDRRPVAAPTRTTVPLAES